MVCLGIITGAHGVRGHLRIRSFTSDPVDIAGYGPLFDEQGRHRLDLEVTGRQRGHVIARAKGIADRAAALGLKGRKLYVPRASLPQPGEDEYYHTDLIGLVAIAGTDEGASEKLGTVRSIDDFGAGCILEIDRGALGSVLVPFTREAVPEVNLADSRIVIRRIPGLIDPVKPADPGAEDDAETE
jgi:16S rRNA processing protein RimM